MKIRDTGNLQGRQELRQQQRSDRQELRKSNLQAKIANSKSKVASSRLEQVASPKSKIIEDIRSDISSSTGGNPNQELINNLAKENQYSKQMGEDFTNLTTSLNQYQKELEQSNIDDPAIRDAMARTTSQQANSTEATQFWNEESRFTEALSNNLKTNPYVFIGKPENKEMFKQLLAMHAVYSNEISDLTSAGIEDPNIRDRYQDTHNKNEINKYQLLFLAKGGNLKDLEKLDCASQLVSYPKSMAAQFSQLGKVLQNEMRDLKSAGLDDPVIKQRANEVSTLVKNTNEAKEFWVDEQKFGQKVMKALSDPANGIYKDPQKKAELDQYIKLQSTLQNEMSDLISAGTDDPSIRSQRTALKKQMESVKREISSRLA